MRGVPHRSKTVGVNVVQWMANNKPDNTVQTVINVFVDGRAESSHGMPGAVSLADALIWYGTQLKLRGE